MSSKKLLTAIILVVSAAFQAQASDFANSNVFKHFSTHYAHSHFKGWPGAFHCARTPPATFDGTITEAAVATEELSTLVTALQLAGLDDALAQPGHFSVFAPTNKAFAAIPEPILTALLNNPDILSTVLLYHVSETKRDPRRGFRRKVKTLAGQPVFFNRKRRTPKINQSNVSCTPVKTSNGTVYVIDSVLLPQFLVPETIDPVPNTK